MFGFGILSILAVLFVALILRQGMADLFGFQLPAGPGTPTLTGERMAILGPESSYILKGIQINGTNATDASNTPTTNLRHGLLMGQETADGLFAHYQPAATNGCQNVQGFLWESRDTIDTDGLAVNPTGQLVICGYFRASQLLLLDEQARRQLQGRVIFDDRIPGTIGGFRQTIAKTANYTVLTSDADTIFTNTGAAGAVTFTLPAVGKGMRFLFQATVAQNLQVTGAANTLVAPNNATATNLTLSTAGNIIGGWIEVYSDDTGTKWLTRSGNGTVTVS